MSETTGHSRRERQIMDIIYSRREATAAEVLAALPDAPSYSAVRALLKVLVDKGALRYRKEGARYVYRPQVPREEAGASALAHMMDVFFDNSVSDAVSTLLDLRGESISDEELERLQRRIQQAREEGR